MLKILLSLASHLLFHFSFTHLVPAMSLVDSAAAFEQRCNAICSAGDLFTGLKAQQVTSFSKLAFAVGTPQAAPSEAQYDLLAAKIFGDAPSLGQVAMLKQLHFESTTLIVASLNEQVKSDSADPSSLSRKLPAAEKLARHTAQQKRLAGIQMLGELCPSHQLLDLANSMVESGVIVWIAPSRCSKRDDEIHANIKPSAASVQVENATLKLAQVPVQTKADLGTELKLQWAYQRRGLALDQCRLLSWDVHELWLYSLLNAITRDCPSGYQQVKTEQIIRADQELWTLLAQLNLANLKPTNDVPVLDAHVKTLTTDPRITMFLLPLPGGHAAKSDRTVKTQPASSSGTQPRSQQRLNQNTFKKRRMLTRSQKACPEELRKFTLKILDGPFVGPICFNYNLKHGCSNSTSSENGCGRCVKGFHACANCHKPGHSVVNCRALANNKSA